MSTSDRPMSDQLRPDTLSDLFAQHAAGHISRRDFLRRGLAIGVSFTMLGTLIRNVQSVGAAPPPQDATPAGTPVATPAGAAGGPPAVGMDGKKRGQDGELKILMWQAPTSLSPQESNGATNELAGGLIVEPLMNYLPDGSLWPNLLAELPTVQNGGISADFKSVTMKLKPGVLWSDGTPFAADDVVFTWQFITNPKNDTLNLVIWDAIASATAVDATTVRVDYKTTSIGWYVPFTDGYNGPIYPKHYIEANGNDVMNAKPIGTGPYALKSFAPNDQIIYTANPNYRDANKPAFATVNIKGGGDPHSVAQAVLQTGDWDFAWNVVIEPDVVKSMEGPDAKGSFRVGSGTGNERLMFNFSDPNATGPDGQRSWYGNPHPLFSDPAVRKAIGMGVDRKLIQSQFYDPREPIAKDLLNGVPALASPNTTWTFDADAANKILDDAGWKKNGSVREKDGKKLEFQFTTTINSVRQKTQQVVKANLAKLGITVNLQQTDSSIFFSSEVGNTQSLQHMYTDMNMYTSTILSTVPSDYMLQYYAGPDRSNIAQQSNGWSAPNVQRYINPDYDTMYEQLTGGTITDINQFNQLIIKMNDLVINDNAMVPLINVGNKYCVHTSLVHGDRDTGEDNVAPGGIEVLYWNIVNWNRATPVQR